jgi:S1-C subfamily serine protease
MRNKGRAVVLSAAVALGVGLVTGGLLRSPTLLAAVSSVPHVGARAADASASQEGALTRARAQDDATPRRSFADELSQVFRAASQAAAPAVVYISAEKTVTVREPDFFFDDPLFREFFGPPRSEKYTAHSLGSGLIVDTRGYVLTNSHVVRGAEQLQVQLADNRGFKAEIVGADAQTDLAVVRILGAPKDLPSAKLGDSDKMAVGDWVLAIGNPFGFAQTVSAGIVSAKGRVLGTARREELLQTDAAINPGNSGGPLVNLDGKVIGINTAIVSSSGGSVGLGFAIPSNTVKSVLPALVKGQSIVRARTTSRQGE